MSSLPAPQKRPQGIVFDWDNTLVDTWMTCYEALNKVLLSYNLPPCTPESYCLNPHLSLRESFPTLFKENAAAAEKEFYDHIRASHLETLHPLPGAEKLLHWLYHQKIYMAVVSNKNGDILRDEVNQLNWTKYFNQIIGSWDTPEDKPSILPLKAALQGSHLKPGPHIWFVGDSYVDMLCATRSGCLPVGVGPHLPEDLPNFPGKDCLYLANLLINL